MSRDQIKRQADQQIISDWINPGARVLDLGCGRGVLLDHLRQTKQVYGVGVDVDTDKILACVRRGISVYQGDALKLLQEFPDGYFDWVICSRTLQELPAPATVIREALRVGSRLAMGFVNFGYWENRLSYALRGEHVVNEVNRHTWDTGHLANPVTIASFERYCKQENLVLRHRKYLRGDWKTPCKLLPNLLAGYVVYDVSR